MVGESKQKLCLRNEWEFCKMNPMKKRILTGDRPTGPLHLGHYVGSLKSRVELQSEAEQFVMIADAQALTDNAKNPEKVRDNIFEVACDYLAVGIDPKQSTILLQSGIPAIYELMVYYLNLVTWNRLKHNPTVKLEITQKGFGESVPAGFMCYPIFQAADITAFKADLVPVGEDQAPMIEQTNEIVRAFNRTYGTETLVPCEALIPKMSRLPGIDGQAKMSKSLNNGIYLSDDADTVVKKVKKMYTDPDHIRVEDPGKVEGNTVFTYLDIFGSEPEKVAELKDQYQRGGLGDMVVKKYLMEELNAFLEPIRERRIRIASDPGHVFDILKEGTDKAKDVADSTLSEVKEAMKINYFITAYS